MKARDTSTSCSTDGCVVVSIDVDRTAEEAWQALTDKASLEMWFGTATDSLTAGVPVRIDFGDGDFFLVEPPAAAAAPPDPQTRVVEFDWRFLGVGPVSHIRWEVRSTADGSQVTVRDSLANRDPDAVRELTEGWRDFFGRLGQYLGTGRNSRYDCRGDIDGVIDLPPTAEDLLGDHALARWLPVVADDQQDRWFQVPDSAVPERFRVSGWRNDSSGVRFAVLIPDSAKSTSVAVRVRPLSDGIRLSFQHAGWNDLGLRTEQLRELRTRFAKAWVSALDQAARIAGLAETGAR